MNTLVQNYVMYTISDGFKLCACSTIPQDKIHWILMQANQANPIVTGMI